MGRSGYSGQSKERVQKQQRQAQEHKRKDAKHKRTNEILVWINKIKDKIKKVSILS